MANEKNLIEYKQNEMEENYHNACNELKKMLKSKTKITATKLAEKIGVSRRTIYSNPKIQNAYKEAKIKQGEIGFITPQKDIIYKSMDSKYQKIVEYNKQLEEENRNLKSVIEEFNKKRFMKL